MLTTIHAANHDSHALLLKTMFAARKRVFIDLLSWNLPVLAERYEVDQFDDHHAVYLVLADARGAHLASARLLPASRPGILNTLFPDLVAEMLPGGPDVWEITRFCLDRDISAKARRQARNLLVTGLACHALAHGIRTYTGVAEFAWLQQILAFGWDCAPLGLPRVHDGKTLGALRIEIAEDTLARLRDAGVFAEPALATNLPQLKNAA